MSSMIVTFKDVELRWKNFSGKADDFNPQGKRFFHIVLNDDMVEELRNVELTTKSGKTVRGANVKTHVPKNNEGDPMYTLKILIGDFFPEEVIRVTPESRMRLNEDNIGNLDREYIEKAKVQVTLSPYERPGNVGITAYCKKLAVWIKEDDFDEDFRDIPEAGNAQFAPNDDSDDGELPF